MSTWPLHVSVIVPANRLTNTGLGSNQSVTQCVMLNVLHPFSALLQLLLDDIMYHYYTNRLKLLGTQSNSRHRL